MDLAQFLYLEDPLLGGKILIEKSKKSNELEDNLRCVFFYQCVKHIKGFALIVKVRGEKRHVIGCYDSCSILVLIRI